jgi:DNA-binding NtrC family response regulator
MPPERELICILDDDPSVRDSIEQLLHSDELRARSFEDAEDFLAHARSHPVPLAPARCLDVEYERFGSAVAAPRSVTRHESDRYDRQGNGQDSRRRARRRRLPFS